MSSNSCNDLNEFFGFLAGLVVGLIVAIIALVYVSGKIENRFERECLLNQTVELNETPFTCERTS